MSPFSSPFPNKKKFQTKKLSRKSFLLEKNFIAKSLGVGLLCWVANFRKHGNGSGTCV